jgi:tetratricopeptide (TPR) repeat protein
MKKIWLFTFVLLSLTLGSRAQEAQGVFEQKVAEARNAYDQGEYALAIKKYTELKNQGLESAQLYYNLGNSEFKSGHIGKAIAYYRKASSRAPGDADIQYNLNYARSLVPHPEDKSGVLTKLFQRFMQRFSGQTAALVALVTYIVFCASIGMLIWQRGKGLFWRWSGSVIGVVFLLIAAWACLRIVNERNVRWGVVVTNQAEARNGPGVENQVGFTVPEGREVLVLGYEKEWKAIGLAQEGFKGWVLSSEIWEVE